MTLDKHTKRYMFERFDFCGEKMSVYDLAQVIDSDSFESAHVYDAIEDLDNEFERNVLKERLLKKQLGWD